MMRPNLIGRLHDAAFASVVIGLAAALLIYILHDGSTGNVIGYQVINGVSYPVLAQDDRRYQSGIERMGGKSALFAANVSNWFSDQWSNHALAYVVAGLTLTLAGGLRVAAHEIAQRDRTRATDGNASG